MSTKSRDVVHETLAASLPPDAPLMFKEITHAHVSGSGRNRVILADLTLFDGAPASVKLEPFQWGWSIQWAHLPGGAFHLEADGVWKRVGGLGEAQGEGGGEDAPASLAEPIRQDEPADAVVGGTQPADDRCNSEPGNGQSGVKPLMAPRQAGEASSDASPVAANHNFTRIPVLGEVR